MQRIWPFLVSKDFEERVSQERIPVAAFTFASLARDRNFPIPCYSGKEA